jgi:hypothetical protein
MGWFVRGGWRLESGKYRVEHGRRKKGEESREIEYTKKEYPHLIGCDLAESARQSHFNLPARSKALRLRRTKNVRLRSGQINHYLIQPRGY